MTMMAVTKVTVGDMLLIYAFLITDSPGDENVSIVLNGVESELRFTTDSKGDKVSCVKQRPA